MGSGIALRPSGSGTLVKVRATPRASRDAVVGRHGDALKIAVRAPPERGRANAAIVLLLARAFDLPASRVRVESGETARDKWVLVEGLDRAALEARLGPLVSPNAT